MNVFKQLLSRRRLSGDLSEEIQQHLNERTGELIEQGYSKDDAARLAQHEFGNMTLIEERGREVWTWPTIESLLADIRYGIRQLRKSPGFTAVAVLTLTLGIGANTALFSVVSGVLLSPLPFANADQLVTLHESKPNFQTGSISFPNFLDWQKDNHTFSGMGLARPLSMTLTGAGDAEQVQAELISSDFFRVLELRPVIGRDFAAGEDQIGAAPIALIGEAFWKRKFDSSPAVLGKTLALDGKAYTIVGVVPSGFDRIHNFSDSPVYLPIGQWSNPALRLRTAGLWFHGIGRLKPGVTIEQARADMDRVTRNLAAAYPDSDKDTGATMFPLKQDIVGAVQPLLLILLAAVGFVLLIACVNVANLMLARSTSRAREFAIRSALGAGRRRLVRQLLTESVLISLTGGLLGLWLASWGTQAALKGLPAALPRAANVGLDLRVLLFTAAVSLLAGVLFGLAPALKVSRSSLQETLNESGRGSSGVRNRTQSVFVALEVAMALVLLAGAGLMIRTMVSLWGVDPGFNPHNVLTFRLALPPSMNNASSEAIRQDFRGIDLQFGATPGVESVSMSQSSVPLGGDDEELFWMEGRPRPASMNDMNWAVKYIVEPDYLRVLGLRVKRGRFFTAQDDPNSPRVVVVDEAFVRKFFPDQDPVGRRINLMVLNGPAQIIGVVGHVKQWAVDSEENQLQAQIYRPIAQLSDNELDTGATFLVRSDGRPDLFDSIREASKRMSAEQVLFNVQTMDQLVAQSLAARQFSMILLAVFAALALFLASIGIYGVVSYWVGHRTHEIGVRLAMGARSGDVMILILGQGGILAASGVAMGLGAAAALTRLMGNLLYGVSALDPLTFAAVAIALIAVGLVACYIPARRATRVNPIVALRCE